MSKLSTFDDFKHIKTDNMVELSEQDMSELHKVLLEMLSDVIEICNKYNLTYYLCGGSSLGAVRDSDIIPWDDDIDVCMSRRDYEKFVEIVLNEHSDKYWFHSPGLTENYPLLMGKLRKIGTTYRTRDDFLNDECGVPIDIFIIENTYDFILMRILHCFLSLSSGYLLSCRKFYRDRKKLWELTKGKYKLKFKFALKIIIGFFISFISIKSLANWGNRINGMCTNSDSKYCTIPAGRYNFWGELYEREFFGSDRFEQLNKYKVRVPQLVELYFERNYGDWRYTPERLKNERHYLYEYKLKK